MRVARVHQSLDERRRVVVDLLDFIHDFNKLDTTLLIQKANDDFKFVEAAEAVLESAIGPWKSVEALRDFAVQALSGEKPQQERDMERVRPRGRVSPFSVPFSLLRTMAPNPGQFDPRNLRSLSETDSLEVAGDICGGDQRFRSIRVIRDEAWLVTTMWARVLPTVSPVSDIQVHDMGANRILHRGKLWALTVEPMPCFWWLPPHSELEVKLTRQRPEPHGTLTVLLAVEGWRYVGR
jgi:hypothetical protein